MGELEETERIELERVVARRIGARGDASGLVNAYLIASRNHAYARTVQAGPVPTSLTVERCGLLLEISKALGRVVEDFEIEALFRISRPQARTMRTTLLATYSDTTDDLTVDWSLIGARRGARTKATSFTGTAIRMSSEEKRDAFVSQMGRWGVETEQIYDDAKSPWKLIVGDEFPPDRLPPLR
jgi:hypothetical protein